MIYCLQDVRNLLKEKTLKTLNDLKTRFKCKITVVEYFNIIIKSNNFLPDQEVNGMKRVRKIITIFHSI